MNKSLVPFKPVDAAGAMARAAQVTGLWHLGREASQPEIQAQHQVAKAALDSGEIAALVTMLQALPTREEFARLLDELIGAFPPREGQDMRTFSRLLAQDVAGLRASRAALSAAYGSLRRNEKWLPSIQEVMDAVEWQKKVVEARIQLLNRLPARVALAEKYLAEGK